MTAKTLCTGKTHTTSGPNGSARSADGKLDIQLPEPHPAAEDLFGAAWSACFMGAIELAASRKKITLPVHPEIDSEIELLLENDAFFLRAHLHVHLQGIEREVAQGLVDAAHEICPYSKATRGNIEVTLTLA